MPGSRPGTEGLLQQHRGLLQTILAIDDVIAVPAAGAYSRSMASNYNHVPRPPVVAVRDGHLSTLLRRETMDDLLALDPGA